MRNPGFFFVFPYLLIYAETLIYKRFNNIFINNHFINRNIMTNETNNLSRAARGLNCAFQMAVITSICVELYEYGKKKYAEYKSRKGTATAAPQTDDSPKTGDEN